MLPIKLYYLAQHEDSIETFNAVVQEAKSEFDEAFATPLVYTYTINGDYIALKLIDPEPIDSEQSTTLHLLQK